jgi:hypothetical protein
MILALLALSFAQDPVPQNPPAPAPEITPPAQQNPPAPAADVVPPTQKPARAADDRLEGRISAETPPKAEAAKPEAPPPKPVEDPMAGWTMLNGPALIVNVEPVTLLDMRRAVEQRARDQNRPKVDPQEMFKQAVTDRSKELLEIQGGKDMGFDAAMIDRFVNASIEREAEEAGSVTKLAERLKHDDKDSFARRDEIYDHVNSELWLRSVTGVGFGAGGRIWRDRFVRPGRALFEQRDAMHLQESRRTVQLTLLVVEIGNPPAPGGKERAEKQINDIRARIENGEDMGELAELFGAQKKGSKGLTPQMPVASLKANYPELGAFLEHAAVQELSPVLPYREKGELAGFALVRPEEFKLPHVEPFDTAEGQQTWIENHKRRMDWTREQQGLMELLGAAYVWPPQAFRASEDKP